MTTDNTPISRPFVNTILRDEIERLSKWLKIIKIHTEDGNILALTDLALDGKQPSKQDYIRDKSNDAL